MKRFILEGRLLVGPLAGLLALACSDSTGPTPIVTDCASEPVLSLIAGQHEVVDPGTRGCVRVPAAGPEGAEYIVVLASTAPNQTTNGVSGPYVIRASNPGSPAAAAPEAVSLNQILGLGRPFVAEQFDGTLRRQEGELAASLRGVPQMPRLEQLPAPPQVGDVRTFKACANVTCSSFVDVEATVRYVGTHSAIFVDNSVPQQDTLLDSDLTDLGQTFDNYHHPIDVAAFGNESDVDGNGVVFILMTDAVNNMTPNCSKGRIVGYFYGLDLILSGPQSTNSNKAEIFYTFVPSPATTGCSAISRTTAVRALKPTLIHEFQHMISWNQHVIIRNASTEESWLNEAFSHFAEELGGRLIPPSECPGYGGDNPCRSQYTSGDLLNAYEFFRDPEHTFLIFPSAITENGSLAERGAGWAFVRWVIDQYAQDTLIGSDLTPSLVQTSARGVANLENATGGDFSTMVPEWLLAAYLDDLPGFIPLSPRLTYRSWGLRSVWTNPLNASLFPYGFPINPATTGGGYARSGTLKGGSGTYLRLVQAANGPAIDVQATADAVGHALSTALVVRYGIARIR